PEEPGHLVGDRRGRVGDRAGLAILIERRALERAAHPITMGPKPEVQLHLDPGARRRRAAPDRVTVAARGGGAVHRPGDGLEQGGLAGTVRADHAGEAGLELERGIGVLPEVDEAKAIDLHQASPSGSIATDSSKVTPRLTNRSRSTRSGRGRWTR